MAATALAMEKVWYDKPAYEKAERLYFERLAKLEACFKVDSHKLMDSNSSNAMGLIHHQEINNIITTKTKSKKSKDNNKTAQLENEANFKNSQSVKNSKNNSKNMKKDESKDSSSIDKVENNINVIEKLNDSKDKDNSKKYKAKEAKEKKNKADKKHRNKEDDKVVIDELQKNDDLKVVTPLCEVQGNQESTSTTATSPILPAGGSLASEVAKARQHIKQSLQCMDGIAVLAGGANQDLATRLASVEKDNQDLRNVVQELKNIITKLDARVEDLERNRAFPGLAICPAKPENEPAPAKEDADDDDVDLFGSDSEGEDAEAARIREERLAAYNAKKSKKPVLIAKSNIILDVKPWDDETDMKVMEEEVRKVETDGLVWGAAKLVPLAFGIHKLQISCVVEDDKVSVDWLTEKLQEIEDYVQSVDIAAFNKV